METPGVFDDRVLFRSSRIGDEYPQKNLALLQAVPGAGSPPVIPFPKK